jgi:hypothetical protein
MIITIQFSQKIKMEAIKMKPQKPGDCTSCESEAMSSFLKSFLSEYKQLSQIVQVIEKRITANTEESEYLIEHMIGG